MKKKSLNILGLRTTCYNVPSLNDAKEWYSLLFDTEPYFDEPFYIGFNIQGYELGLLPNESIKTSDNVLSYWGVSNIQEIKETALKIGAKIHEDITNVGGPLEVFSIFDPWGNVIGFIYNPEFKLP